MLAFFKDVLNMTYNSSSYKGSKHETRIKKLLTKHKFKEIPKKTELRNGEFIYQPNGNNNNPDFRVKYKGKVYDIECKSSEGSFPTYNSAYPKEGFIYIFTSKKYDATTIYFGRDVYSREMEILINKMLDEMYSIHDKYKPLFKKADSLKRGFGFYLRDMHIQEGGKEFTDYFAHPDRERCEQNVLNTFR